MHATFHYTCCTQPAHVTRVGDTLKLGWSAVDDGPPTRPIPRTPMVLRITLSGPFGSLADVKSDSASPQTTIRSAPIRTTNYSDGSPTSTLKIPGNAQPGYYSLDFTVRGGGSGYGAGEVIKIAPHH